MLLIVLPLLLSSCSLFRPSPERQCRKAEGHIAKALRICPEAANLRTDTLTIHLPGDSSSGERLWTDADLDSVLAGCQQLREALDAERQLTEITNGVASRIVSRQQRALDSLRTALATKGRTSAGGEGVDRLRRSLCRFPDIHDSTELYELRITYSDSGPLYTIHVFDRTASVAHTTQPIVRGPVTVQDSANGWLVAGTILGGIGWLVAVVLFLMFKSERHLRLNPPRTMKKILPLLLPLLLPFCARAQSIPLITNVYPSPDGTSTLELRGLFHDADTVLVQVYHDSDVITEEVRIYTWAIALGQYPWYVLKFTADHQRVKYLYIFELNSSGIEYVPEITIDFAREGNLLLYKPSDGKPDFLQFDVGLSRKH